MFKVASWNLNSIRSRLIHVTTWLQAREPDVLLLQELKGTEFPSEAFKPLGYESVAVTQKAYNGVAILSRQPMNTIAKALVGDDSDSHARFLEVIIKGIRIVNIYLPNGNPVGSDRFAYKLAWMDRLNQQMIRWKQDGVPTLVGGDFNVIPEKHRLSQAVFMGTRCSVSAGAASPISCDVGYGLYGCVPVVARGRNRILHILGLLSAGVRTQSRHTNRSLLIIPNASKSTRRLRDR